MEVMASEQLRKPCIVYRWRTRTITRGDLELSIDTVLSKTVSIRMNDTLADLGKHARNWTDSYLGGQLSVVRL